MIDNPKHRLNSLFRLRNMSWEKAYTSDRCLRLHRGHRDGAFLSTSAIILAGGHSTRFGQDKGLLQLAGKPLVRHVIEAVNSIVNDKIVVVSCKGQVDEYVKATGSSVSIIVDRANGEGPLAGTLTGLEETRAEYSLLLSCDTPFVVRDILELLLELCRGRNACVPRWPNGYVEPLQAVYRKEPALQASKTALCAGSLNVQSMLDRLQHVRYVSTLVLKQLDPELNSFFNVNTPLDLKTAEQMLRRPG